MTDQKPALNNATIGLITALTDEYAAVTNLLDCYHTVTVAGRTYRIGTVQRRDNTGAHTIVACCLSDMGNSSAAARTTALLADCKNVDAVIMCGIAGAVPNLTKPADHVRLGDVVVTNRRGVVQYDNECVRERKVEIRERWHTPSRILVEAALELKANEKLGERPWDRYIARAITELGKTEVGHLWQRPSPDKDVLREFSARRIIDYIARFARAIRVPSKLAPYGRIPHPIDGERITGAPKIFHGVIASADKLQKNAKNRDFLGRKFGAMAVEMEGSGVANAAYEFEAKFFVVRGTCDYCNEYKNDDWHRYAAIAAAAYTRALLEVTPLPRLSGREDGPTTTSHIVNVQNIPIDQPQPGDAQTSDAEVATDVAQDELGRALGKLLEEEGKRNLNEIMRCLDAWEFRHAFSMGEIQDAWVEKYKDKLPKQLVRDIYAVLVRVAIVKANEEREEGKPPDMSHAEHYLTKAKNVPE